MKRFALLVIDMNVGSFNSNARGGILHRAKEHLVPCINGLAAAFRTKGLTVIWVTQRFKDDLSNAPVLQRKSGDKKFVESSDGWKLLPELDVQPGDQVVVKRLYSAFFDTDLHERLQQAEVTSLVIPGVNTYACVRATTLDAYQHGYDPIIWPRDGIAASLPQFEQDTLRYMLGDAPGRGLVEGLLSNEEIITRL